MQKINFSINGYLKIYDNDILVFEDHNDIIHLNFLEVIGNSMAGTVIIQDMKFGTGTGTIDTTDLVSGLFTEVYSEPVLGAGNIYDYSVNGNTLTLNFSVTMMRNNGNGSGSVNYTECGLFDSAGKKLTHIVFPVVTKNSSNILRFYYSVDIKYDAEIPYLGESLVNAFIPMQTANDEIVLSGTQTFARASSATYISPTTGLITTAAINEQRFEADPISAVVRSLIEGSNTNEVLNSDVLVTQSVTTTAALWTLSFYGTGSVALSGAYTGNLSGTGANTRVSLTFLSTAASLTLTVTGSVTQAQLEQHPMATSYIPTTASPVTRSPDSLSIANGNIPLFSNGATFSCTASIPNDGLIHDLFSAIDAGKNLVLQRDTTGVLKGELGGLAFTTTHTPDTAEHVYTLRTDGTNHSVLVDGTSVHTFTGVIANPTTALYIGSDSGTTNHLYSLIGNMKIYPRFLTDLELNK